MPIASWFSGGGLRFACGLRVAWFGVSPCCVVCV